MSKILRVALGLMVAWLLMNAIAQSTGAETLIPITVTLFYVGLALLIVEAAHMAVSSTGQYVRHVVSSAHSWVFPGRSM